jgi:hypothetical protein
LPSTGLAQGGLHLSVTPRFGLLVPDQQLYEVFEDWPLDPVQWTAGWLKNAAVAGVGVDLEPGFAGLRVRAELLRSFDGWLRAVHGLRRPRVLFQPPEIRETWFDVPATVTILGFHLVLPTQLLIWRARPYLMAGYSAKWYSFGEPDPVNEVNATFPDNGFVPSLDLGAGFTVPLSFAELDLVARDVLSEYWGWKQHDIVVAAGLTWRLF